MVASSVAEARGLVGYLDFAEARRRALLAAARFEPGALVDQERHLQHPAYRAPEDNLTLALEFLEGHRRSIPQAFVRLLVSPRGTSGSASSSTWWDIVPVIVQDPIWEQSFPPVDGIVVPLAGADGRVRARAPEGRESESAVARTSSGATRCSTSSPGSIEPVLLSSADHEHILAALMEWAANREFEHGRGWR